MAVGKIGAGGRGFGREGSAVLGTASASSYASHAAPTGFHWAFVTYQGARVTLNSVPVVALVAN
jgi:hypothetical protein